MAFVLRWLERIKAKKEVKFAFYFLCTKNLIYSMGFAISFEMKKSGRAQNLFF